MKLAEFLDRYDNPMYRHADGTWMDEGFQNWHAVLVAAESLTGAARQQFTKAFSQDFAMDGGVYVTSRATASATYAELCAQAPALGIKLFIRGGEL